MNDKPTKENLDEKLAKLSKEILQMKIAVGALLALTVIMFAGFNFLIGMVAALASFVFIFLIRKKLQKKKSAAYDLIKTVIQKHIDLTEYSPNGHIPEYAIENTRLMPHWDEFSGSDLVQGTYKGVNIAFSDIHLVDIETYTDSDGNRQTRRDTVFQGQWIVCELPKTIKRAVRLKEKPKIRLLPHKSDVETENIAFNKKYQILTDDPHTMFYILTPHFMEYILSADLLAEGQTYFCFEGNHVYIAIDNRRDAFKMKSKHESVEKLQERIEKEVKYLIEIIDELMKNEYLFGGEK